MTRGGRGTRTLVADRPLDCLTDSVQYPLATRSKRLPVNGILVRTIQSDETQFAICVIAFPNWNRDFANGKLRPIDPTTCPGEQTPDVPSCANHNSVKKHRRYRPSLSLKLTGD